jgi:hypothetical protein
MDNQAFSMDASDIACLRVSAILTEDIVDHQDTRVDLVRPPCMGLWMQRFLVKSDRRYRRHLLIFDMERQGSLVSRIPCPSHNPQDQITFISVDEEDATRLYFQYSPSGLVYRLP